MITRVSSDDLNVDNISKRTLSRKVSRGKSGAANIDNNEKTFLSSLLYIILVLPDIVLIK